MELDFSGGESAASSSSADDYASNSANRMSDTMSVPHNSEDLTVSRIATTVSNKRKASNATKPRKKRKPNDNSKFINEYQKLLNSDIAEFVNRFRLTDAESSSDRPSRKTKQYGMTTWSSEERGQLFQALARYGRGALPHLQAAVPTKSEFEIVQYIQVIGNYLDVELEKKPHRQRLADYSDIPAALEVSGECCLLLDEMARKCSKLENERVSSTDQYHYGEHSRIDKSNAASLLDLAENERLDKHVHNESPPLPSKALNAAQLFDLDNWLELSEKIFMNPATEDNWHNAITDEERTPSILISSVIDIYNIIVALTKKIISTSIFQALSRLRALDLDKKRRPAKPEVIEGDVHTALDILNMRRDSFDHWIHVPRNCQLNIYGKNKTRLTYDEVEQFLASDATTRDPAPLPSKIHKEESIQISDSDSDSDIDDAPRLPFDGEEDADPTIAVHDRADTLDTIHSAEEESRLWTLLTESPPSPNHKLQPQDLASEDTSRNPARHEHADFADWRDNVDYCAEWERYGYRIPEEDFKKMNGGVGNISRSDAAGWPRGQPPRRKRLSVRHDEDEEMRDGVSGMDLSHHDSDEDSDSHEASPRSVPSRDSEEADDDNDSSSVASSSSSSSSSASTLRRSQRSASLPRPKYTLPPLETDEGVKAAMMDISSDEDEYTPDPDD